MKGLYKAFSEITNVLNNRNAPTQTGSPLEPSFRIANADNGQAEPPLADKRTFAF